MAVEFADVSEHVGNPYWIPQKMLRNLALRPYAVPPEPLAIRAEQLRD